MTLGDDAYQILELAAKSKFISVQELLRAVIIPEWVEENHNRYIPSVDGTLTYGERETLLQS